MLSPVSAAHEHGWHGVAFTVLGDGEVVVVLRLESMARENVTLIEEKLEDSPHPANQGQ